MVAIHPESFNGRVYGLKIEQTNFSYLPSLLMVRNLEYNHFVPDRLESKDFDSFKLSQIDSRISMALEKTIFYKLEINDTKILGMLANHAYMAREAACLKSRRDGLGPKVMAGFPQKLSSLQSGEPQQAIIFFRSHEVHYSNRRRGTGVAVRYSNLSDAFVEELFYNRWLKASVRFWEKMIKFKTMENSFTFTGFGRAGVFAVYAALEFVTYHNLKTRPVVVTFGMPLMGNIEFVKYVYSKLDVYRVTYADDWTPLWPKFGNNPETKAIIYYAPLATEYWIPIQNQCECAPTYIQQKPPIFPTVFKCFAQDSFRANPVFKFSYLVCFQYFDD
ncbi:hypothetical protein G9A89_014338 [Geosiphon pyriformis]|nr:hypothetical protein G9A89_014338 [Geosiphon pyriformis]